MRGWFQWWRQKSPPARRMSNPRKWRRKRCRPAMQRKSTKTGPGVVNAGAQDGCADSALAIRFADVEVCPVQFEFLRSADPHSPIAPANWEPAPAAVVVVVGINARPTKARAEMGGLMEVGGVMEAAQVTDGVETAAELTGTVDAAMERASTAVTAAMSASMTATVSPAVTPRAPSRWSGRELPRRLRL